MYAELHCLTNFSFLRGASHAHELVERAHALGYRALAVTDECSLAGVVKAHVAAKAQKFKLIIGAEFFLQENSEEETPRCHVIALAMNRTGYSELSALITLARRRGSKGSYVLHLRELEHNLRHNLLIWKPDHRHDNEHIADVLKAGFGDRLWLGYSHLLRGDEVERFAYYRKLSQQFAVPITACGAVAMHHSDRKILLDALTAIHHNTSIEQLGYRRDGNSERYLRDSETLRSLYPADLLDQSTVIAEQCRFSLDELRYEYPHEVVPPTMTSQEYLSHQVMLGARERWPDGVPDDIQQRIEKELALIRQKNYEYYFLTVYDIVNFARGEHILCQGRGSAANSVVCYCLHITEVCPQQTQLLFERFISEERDEPPDIDVDFEHERREEVIQYIYKKYGRERAALAASVICYRTRSAIRDIGKALGFDVLLIDQLAKSLAWWDDRKELLERCGEIGLNIDSHMVTLFFSLVQQLRHFPRHLSQHVGGFVISQSPISTLVPVENAAMVDRTVIQWDKQDLEAVGLMKIDVLALGMLTAIRKTLALIAPRGGPARMQEIPQGDKHTYDMLQRADSVGVFQVESRAQMTMLPRLKPKEYYDLVVQVAIVRPGPIQGNMVHPYLRRRQGIEPIPDMPPIIWNIVKRTYGVPIFQEQVIKLAMDAAGFSGGEADRLRRAMASWGQNGDLLQFREKLINGMTMNGHSEEFALVLFEMMKGFGSYGFPESHAASFALLVYVSAWLKQHYPAAFYCGLLNSQPMGFYSSSQLVQDARRHDIDVRSIDIHHSAWEHTLEYDTAGSSPALRLGFCLVKGFGKEAAERLISARAHKAFTDIADLQQRVRLAQNHLRSLIAADALQALSGHRHQSHWQAQAIIETAPLIEDNDYDDAVQLPAPSEFQTIAADYQSTSLTLKRHPLSWLRERCDLIRQCKTQRELIELNQHRFVRVAGIVTGRQRPGTASGIVFVTLEDETGNINVVVRTDVQQRCRHALLQAQLMLVKGIVESSEGITHVLAGELIDCSHYLNEIEFKSRDFH